MRLILRSNIHTTFPSDPWDHKIRLNEIKTLTRELDAFVAANHLEHAISIVAGDMNGDTADPVVQHLFRYDDSSWIDLFHDACSAGFRSAFEAVHGREPGVTHCNHLGASRMDSRCAGASLIHRRASAGRFHLLQRQHSQSVAASRGGRSPAGRRRCSLLLHV